MIYLHCHIFSLIFILNSFFSPVWSRGSHSQSALGAFPGWHQIPTWPTLAKLAGRPQEKQWESSSLRSSCCRCTKPAASSGSSLWGPSKYLTSSPCSVPEFIIRSPELLQSVISSNWCDLALGHRVKLICRPAGDGRCPLHLRKVACGFLHCHAARGCHGKRRLSGGQEGVCFPCVLSLPAAPVRWWRGVTATSECLGITPARGLTLPPWPRKKLLNPWQKTVQDARGISMLSFEGCSNTGSHLRAGIGLCYPSVFGAASACVRGSGQSVCSQGKGRAAAAACRGALFPAAPRCCSVQVELQSLHRFSF